MSFLGYETVTSELVVIAEIVFKVACKEKFAEPKKTRSGWDDRLDED